MAIIVVPGPCVLFTLARSVAVLAVLGNSAGTRVLSSGVALGLGFLLSRTRTFAIALQLLGDCYLLWLGASALRRREAPAAAMTKREDQRPGPLLVVRQGFVVGVSNPKSPVFFVAVFPHFVDRASGSATLQLRDLTVISVRRNT